MRSEAVSRASWLVALRTDASAPRPIIVGEVAQAHDGSLGMAHAFIDAIARAGADAVKFQTHIAAAESTPAEPWRVAFRTRDASRFDYWRRMEFDESEWLALRRHADDVGLRFVSSPFSLEAIELLERVGLAAWKVASGEVGHGALIDRLCRSRRPVLLSSGLSDYRELDAAVARVRAADVPFAVLQCTTAYPCPPERVGLNVLAELRARYGAPVGLSDHSGTPYAGLAAAALGADVLEVHVTLSREAFGPDVPASVTTAELRQLVDGCAFIGRALAHPVHKDAPGADTAALRAAFTKSVVARVDLAAGTVLRVEHLSAKKPGTGIPADALPTLLGRRLRVPVLADTLLSASDLAEDA